jgi:hypothetical protein
MVKYTDYEIEDKLEEEYRRGIKVGIETVEYHLKNKSCINCKYGFITSDWSVGIGEHLDECGSPIVFDYRLEELDNLWHKKFDHISILDEKFENFEDWLPKYCGSFVLDFDELKRQN